MKNHLVNYIDPTTMKILSHNATINRPLFEIDVIEALGFQNGERPELDLKHCGLLSMLQLIQLVEQVKLMYEENKPELSVYQQLHQTMFDKSEILMLNILSISQEQSLG
jgi:hypothetical protein